MAAKGRLMLTVNIEKRILKKLDTIMYMLALGYVILPIIIFLGGWTKWPVFFCGTMLLLYTGYQIFHAEKMHADRIDIITADNKKFWLITSVCICVWVYLSGIGGFSHQNSDFWVRNPIYNDLCSMSWPVYYDLSKEPAHVQQYLGSDTVAFSYYYTWWLLPALICKIFGFTKLASNIVLYLHAVTGVILLHYLLCKIVKKCSWLCIGILVFFSGLDVVTYLIKSQTFPNITQSLEWSSEFFQYSGNTTQLFYVFNQSIPVWIIAAIILSTSSRGGILRLSAV